MRKIASSFILGAGVLIAAVKAEFRQTPVPRGTDADLAARHLVPPPPRLWLFLRPGCRHCNEHENNLLEVLRSEPPWRRDLMRRHLQVCRRGVESPECDDDIRHAPFTFWVGRDSSLSGSWLGRLSQAEWRELLRRFQRELLP